ALGETGFQESVKLIEESRRVGRDAREALLTARAKLQGLHEQVRKIREDMEPMWGVLGRLEAELVGLAWALPISIRRFKRIKRLFLCYSRQPWIVRKRFSGNSNGFHG